MLKPRAALAAVLAAAALACAASAAPQPVAADGPVQCSGGVPCAVWQDVNTTGVQQDLELFDHDSAPVWWVNNAGGMWVGNDRLGVTGASVYDLAAYLAAPDGVHGALYLDGVKITARQLRWLLSLQAAGLTAADVAWIHRHGG